MFIKQHFHFVYRSPKFRVHERGRFFFRILLLLWGMLIHNLPYKGLISPIAVIDVIKDARYVQRSPLEILDKVCLTEVFITSESNFLIEFSLNTVAIILCQSLRPQLKLILWKSRFELFVNITSIRLGEPFFVKHVGSLMRFVI